MKRRKPAIRIRTRPVVCWRPAMLAVDTLSRFEVRAVLLRRDVRAIGIRTPGLDGSCAISAELRSSIDGHLRCHGDDLPLAAEPSIPHSGKPVEHTWHSLPAETIGFGLAGE